MLYMFCMVKINNPRLLLRTAYAILLAVVKQKETYVNKLSNNCIPRQARNQEAS